MAEHATVDSIRVSWPLGTVETWYNLPTNASLEFTEGEMACAAGCPGCTYVGACNFDSSATEDDGSCDFSCLIEESVCGVGLVWNPSTEMCEAPCPADFTGDGIVDVADLLVMLGAFATYCP